MVAHLGRIYTPTPIAQRLAAFALDGWDASKAPRVCDPACGDGELLRAVREQRADASLFGIDIDSSALAAPVGSRTELLHADALTYAWRDRSFDIVIANPPWVSYSGRHAAPLPPDRRTALRERYELFRSWPSLHAAFVQLAVRIARWRVAILLPAQVCDLERYAPVRSFLRAHGRLREPALSLGEDAFDGVIQPSCILVLDRSLAPGVQGDHPILLGEGRGEGVAVLEGAGTREGAGIRQGYPALLDRLPRAPRDSFGDIGVHTGNCSRALIGIEGVPVREGRDIAPYALAAPRKRFRSNHVAAGSEYFRAAPLAKYREIPIVLRQTASHPIAALHTDPTYFRNSVLACRGIPGVADDVLVAWLNNSLVAAYHRARVRESGQRTFPQVKVRHLRDLPLPALGRVPDSIRGLAQKVAREGRIQFAQDLDAALARWVISDPSRSASCGE